MSGNKGVAVITGGSRGIGAAAALAIAAASWKVVVNYRSDEKAAQDVAGKVREAGGEAIVVQADVAEPGDIERLFSEADKLGPVTALVNNAGIVDVSMRLEDMPVERIERMMRVNVTGSFLCAQQAVRRMSTKNGGKGGAIVNLSSAAAVHGSPGQYIDYAASKGAIDTFTKGLGLEVATEGIRVNAIRPGIIDTDIHASGGEPDRVRQMRSGLPMKREGKAEEVANAIVWLLSDAASYVTGAVLDVSGGR